MKSPVNFVPLAKELEPMAPYLRGRVLNAGCGNRDVTALLRGWHATEVENCDLAPSLPGAFACDLTSIPRPDSCYDSILCNAVLEHVAEPDRVVAELRRLLADGGHLVLSVPFLQPFHPTPADFRRYTKEGVELLAQRGGFTVVELRPVHSLAQTLGWLVWTYLEERGARFAKVALWVPTYLLTRWVQTPPRGQVFVANAFQAVLRKR